jgi:hypothetical protein
MKLAKTNVPGLVKDKNTNTVINKNDGEYEGILAARQQRRDFKELQNDVQVLKEQMKLILETLKINE